jgi:hypothetical protein
MCHGSSYHTWTMGPGLNLRTSVHSARCGVHVWWRRVAREGCGTEVTMDSVKLQYLRDKTTTHCAPGSLKILTYGCE